MRVSVFLLCFSPSGYGVHHGSWLYSTPKPQEPQMAEPLWTLSTVPFPDQSIVPSPPFHNTRNAPRPCKKEAPKIASVFQHRQRRFPVALHGSEIFTLLTFMIQVVQGKQQSCLKAKPPIVFFNLTSKLQQPLEFRTATIHFTILLC